MKTFGYTIRDKTGALKRGSLQARDRTDALRQIKDMGGIPVVVTEGKAPVAGARTPWNPATWRPAVWVGAAAGVVLIVAFSVWRTAAKKPTKHPASATTTAETPRRGARSALPTNQTVEIAQPAPKPVPVADPAAVTPPQVGHDETVQSKATIASEKRPPPMPTPTLPEEEHKPPRPSPYRSKTEALLSMAMSVPPGAMIPPMPITPDLEADFAQSLTNDILVFDDDDERAIEHKMNVANAKSQLRELVKQGHSVSEVLKAYQESTNDRVAVRNEAQRELAELVKNGKPDAAKAYLEEVNKSFTELGIEPIEMPRRLAR